jgi:hypothetical protein
MRPTIFLMLALGLVVSAHAALIRVPQELPTIQAGLYAAGVGDTVLVACGTYDEYNILVTPHVTLLSETGQPDCVTIDGQSLGRVLLCSELGSDTRIEGFTITGGLAQGEGNLGKGGGLFSQLSAQVMTHCDFRENHAVRGGGACCEYGTERFEFCRFVDNSTETVGGGVSINESDATFLDCEFVDNESEMDAGAVNLTHAAAVFERTIFRGNESRFWGGALMNQGYAGTTHLLGCTLVGNRTALSWGGAIFTCGEATPIIENCIVAFNDGDAAINAYDATSLPTVICCDVFGNIGGDYGGALGDQTGINGNISAPPLFCHLEEHDYHLASTSPCLPENNACGVLMGALDQGCLQPAAVEEHAPVGAGALSVAMPNPFRPGMAFTLTDCGPVEVVVYDVRGRFVRRVDPAVRRSSRGTASARTGTRSTRASISTGPRPAGGTRRGSSSTCGEGPAEHWDDAMRPGRSTAAHFEPLWPGCRGGPLDLPPLGSLMGAQGDREGP